LPEIGLGIGYEEQSSGGWLGEWLYWYSEEGDRYQTAEELVAQERQEKEKLARYLRSIGINPDEIPE
jgi:hypothetical protein